MQDVTAESGIQFVHQPGQFQKYEMPSIMGSGCALVDFDRDGLLDLYVVNGSPSDAKVSRGRGDGFFHGIGDGRFEDVSRFAGIEVSEYGMGAWWGDFDADGFPDLFLTNVGRNRLFRNLGDGTLVEIPLPPGVVQEAWSTAACWCDFDGDGDLDLFVVNYVDYVPGQHCEGPDGRREFCGPTSYQGTVDRMLMNQGSESGTLFVDETIRCGLGNSRGKGLGTVAHDFDGDGRVDLYVANDMEANRLWIQQQDGSFQDKADLKGVARNFLGEAEASMGIVVGDWNGDASPDLFVTHLAGETNTLYLSDGRRFWQDATAASRLGPPSLPQTGFGIGACDFEHDGDIDFLIANGGVKRPSSAATDNPALPYAQPNAFFLRKAKSVSFEIANDLSGDFAKRREISRAIAIGDVDQDGDCDVVVSNCGGPCRLYRNVATKKGNWLKLKLVDTVGHRDAIGARARIVTAGGKFEQHNNPYQGYLTQNEEWLHYGLGQQSRYESIEVRWPDGQVESFPGGASNRMLILIRGRRTVLERNRIREADLARKATN